MPSAHPGHASLPVASAVVCPAWMVTLLPLPWLVELTKSALGASATVRLTGSSAAGAASAVTVNTASVPSVTAAVLFTAMLIGRFFGLPLIKYRFR